MMDGSIAHGAEIDPTDGPRIAVNAAEDDGAAREADVEAAAGDMDIEDSAAEDADTDEETPVAEGEAATNDEEPAPGASADQAVAEEAVAPVAGVMTHELRVLEAMLFAATEPVEESSLAERLPEGADLAAMLAELSAHYEGRGVQLYHVAGRWAFRTADDLAGHLTIERKVTRKLSRASVETLAIIAYHQPITRGEIEEIRGVALSKGTLDLLLEIGWIRPVGRRRTPGRPVTWGTSTNFLDQFGLNSLSDLPGVEELKAAGLLDSRPVTTILGEAMGRDMESEVPAEESGDEEEPEEERVAGSMDSEDIETSFEPEGDEAEAGDDGEAEDMAEAEVSADVEDEESEPRS